MGKLISITVLFMLISTTFITAGEIFNEDYKRLTPDGYLGKPAFVVSFGLNYASTESKSPTGEIMKSKSDGFGFQTGIVLPSSSSMTVQLMVDYFQLSPSVELTNDNLKLTLGFKFYLK